MSDNIAGQTVYKNENINSNNNNSDSNISNNVSDINEKSREIFPERRVDHEKQMSELYKIMNRTHLKVMKCERKVADIIEKHPLVKIMMGALKNSGCEVDVRRHISCETCGPEVTGGYDPVLNQVVICYNRIWSKKMIGGVLSHEMLHMWDSCRAHLDFNNLDHIACSEIRAANLFHCSITSSFFLGTTSIIPFNFKQSHALCVKVKAVASLVAVRPEMTYDDAWPIVNRVFDKCYNDLEPIGRRIRRNSRHMDWVYRERFHYNYD